MAADVAAADACTAAAEDDALSNGDIGSAVDLVVVTTPAAAVAQVIRRALCRNREERYQSAENMKGAQTVEEYRTRALAIKERFHDQCSIAAGYAAQPWRL